MKKQYIYTFSMDSENYCGERIRSMAVCGYLSFLEAIKIAQKHVNEENKKFSKTKEDNEPALKLSITSINREEFEAIY